MMTQAVEEKKMLSSADPPEKFADNLQLADYVEDGGGRC